MSNIVSSDFINELARLSIMSSSLLSKEQINLQARIALTSGVKTDFAPFTGIPANSLTAAQSSKWAAMLEDQHARLWRQLFRASGRTEAEKIKDALVSLHKYYTVRIFHLIRLKLMF